MNPLEELAERLRRRQEALQRREQHERAMLRYQAEFRGNTFTWHTARDTRP